MAKEFTDANFETEVINSQMPVLVDFWAPWCQPCRVLSPIIDELSTENEGKASIGKVNVDDNSVVSAIYGIRSIPALILFKNGEIVDKKVGAISKSAIQEMIDKVI